MLFDITLNYPKFRKEVAICLFQGDVEDCSLVLDKDGQPGNYLWIHGPSKYTYSNDNPPSIIESLLYFSYFERDMEVAYIHPEGVSARINMRKLMNSIVVNESSPRERDVKSIRLYMDYDRQIKYQLIRRTAAEVEQIMTDS